MNDSITRKTIGLDVSDRKTQICVLNKDGIIVKESTVATRREALIEEFRHLPTSRLVLEVGPHSRWVSSLLSEFGHEVIVANPRRVRLIWAEARKTDRLDAEKLARIGRLDPKLLFEVHHRSDAGQLGRTLLKSRKQLIGCRTKLINSIRGLLKTYGIFVPAGGTAETFHVRVLEFVPAELLPIVTPLLRTMETLTREARALQKQVLATIEALAPEASHLLDIDGVGPLTVLAFITVFEDPARFRKARNAGAYVGLVPRLDASGDKVSLGRVSREGDVLLRAHLVQCAHYILGPFGKDSALRRYGLRLAERNGGPLGRRKAVVAVARKLAVLMLMMWNTGVCYEPLYGVAEEEQAA